MNQQRFLLKASSIAVLMLIAQLQAQAQSQSSNAPAPAVAQEIQQVVITGTALARGTRKIDTAFSIPTATEEQLKMAAPSSTADVLKLVPGVYAESTGGQSGANVEVR